MPPTPSLAQSILIRALYTGDRAAMWRSASSARILRRVLAGAGSGPTVLSPWPGRQLQPRKDRLWAHLCSSASSPSVVRAGGAGIGAGGAAAESILLADPRRLLRQVNVEALKTKLAMEEKEVIGYSKLLEVCEGTGLATSKEEAAAFARVLDDAGVVLLFRDWVFLHPEKISDLMSSTFPFLTSKPENDPRHEELKQLEKKKEEIDMLAHKQVIRILWSGLGFLVANIGLFFRLTFWEFSWDVMEPVAFFATTSGILIGYAYFLFTYNDPTYQDLMKRLFLSRQRKLFERKSFDMRRFMELQKHCKSPSDNHIVMN